MRVPITLNPENPNYTLHFRKVTFQEHTTYLCMNKCLHNGPLILGLHNPVYFYLKTTSYTPFIK